MTNRIKTDLAQRINQYVSYRRSREKVGGSFAETMASRSAGDKSVSDRVTHERVGRVAQRMTGGRSRRQIRTPNRTTPHHYSKHITEVQASRLARYAPVIQHASRKYGVPVELICAVILQESGGRAQAVSHCGARGLMQLMPATARRLGVANSNDPAQNIMGGTKYLRMLLDRFDGNVALALAGYNAGEGNVEKYGRKIPPFKETRAYVPNVLKYADTIWNILRESSPVSRVSANPTIHHRTIFSVSRRA